MELSEKKNSKTIMNEVGVTTYQVFKRIKAITNMDIPLILMNGLSRNR